MRCAHIFGWRLIPQRNFPTYSEIPNFYLIIRVDQYISRFDIPMNDKFLIDENHSLNDRF